MGFDAMRSIIAQKMRLATPQSTDFKIARIFDTWKNILSKMWGEERAAMIRPVSFKDGVLKFATSVPAAKQQLMVESPRFVNEINRQLGAKVVQKIIVVSEGF